jgi:hypothetical protein
MPLSTQPKKAKTGVAQQNMGDDPFQTLACRLHQIREEILKEFQLGPALDALSKSRQSSD